MDRNSKAPWIGARFSVLSKSWKEIRPPLQRASHLSSPPFVSLSPRSASLISILSLPSILPSSLEIWQLGCFHIVHLVGSPMELYSALVVWGLLDGWKCGTHLHWMFGWRVLIIHFMGPHLWSALELESSFCICHLGWVGWMIWIEVWDPFVMNGYRSWLFIWWGPTLICIGTRTFFSAEVVCSVQRSSLLQWQSEVSWIDGFYCWMGGPHLSEWLQHCRII